MATAAPQYPCITLRQSESAAGNRRIPIFLGLAGAPVTGLSGFTGSEIQVVNNGGSFANFAGTMTEIGAGVYMYETTQAELGSTGWLCVKVNKTGADITLVFCSLIAWNRNTLVNSRPDVNVGAMSNDTVTAAAIADGAIDAATFAAGAVSYASMGLTAAAVSGTGTATTFVTTLTQTADDHWRDAWIVLTSGVLIGSCRQISAYNGTTKAITVAHAFPSTPANAVTFVLINR